MDKKELFIIYNKLRAIAKNDPNSKIEMKRLNKAFGIILRDEPSKYYTTETGCTCPDAMNRSQYICKHRLALLIKTNPQQLLMEVFLS